MDRLTQPNGNHVTIIGVFDGTSIQSSVPIFSMAMVLSHCVELDPLGNITDKDRKSCIGDACRGSGTFNPNSSRFLWRSTAPFDHNIE